MGINTNGSPSQQSPLSIRPSRVSPTNLAIAPTGKPSLIARIFTTMPRNPGLGRLIVFYPTCAYNSICYKFGNSIYLWDLANIDRY